MFVEGSISTGNCIIAPTTAFLPTANDSDTSSQRWQAIPRIVPGGNTGGKKRRITERGCSMHGTSADIFILLAL
jgi:hypothetical protein